MVKVARVIVNESEGKRPEQYIIRDINPNFQNMSVAQKTTADFYVSGANGAGAQNNYTAPNGGGSYAGGSGSGGGVGNSRFTQAMNESCIDAKHIDNIPNPQQGSNHIPLPSSKDLAFFDIKRAISSGV
jgi:hypothetical protein